MTPASVSTFGVLIIAVLTALVGVMAFIHTQVMPQLIELSKDFYELRQSNALSAQVNQQNTVRLNGQSAKIDTLMLATPSIIMQAPIPVPMPVPMPVETPPAPPVLIDAPIRPADAAEIAAARAELNQVKGI